MSASSVSTQVGILLERRSPPSLLGRRCPVLVSKLHSPDCACGADTEPYRCLPTRYTSLCCRNYPVSKIHRQCPRHASRPPAPAWGLHQKPRRREFGYESARRETALVTRRHRSSAKRWPFTGIIRWVGAPASAPIAYGATANWRGALECLAPQPYELRGSRCQRAMPLCLRPRPLARPRPDKAREPSYDRASAQKKGGRSRPKVRCRKWANDM